MESNATRPVGMIAAAWQVAAACIVTIVAILLSPLAALAVERGPDGPLYCGDPVALKGNAMYFTSWKYVRPGSVSWNIKQDPGAVLSGIGLESDGNAVATFGGFDKPRGIRLVAQRASLMPVKVREGQEIAHLYDQGKFKTWAEVAPCEANEPFSTKDRIVVGQNKYLRYAESEDGEHWTSPKLGLYEYAGNKDNSICFRGDVDGSVRGLHAAWVFVDPTSVEERYKLCYVAVATPEEMEAFKKKYPGQADPTADRGDVMGHRLIQSLFGAVSPDGIHWKTLDEPLMIHHADTLNTCDYDAATKQYVAYVRSWQVPMTSAKASEEYRWIGIGRRSIGRAYSSDFRHFSPPEIVLSTAADMNPCDVLYTNCKTTVPGTDDHVMFPWIWEMDSDGGTAWLYSSPDGAHWSKVPGGPVVEQGPPGSPMGGFVICSSNLLEFPDGTWRIACHGNPIPHKYPGRGSVRTLNRDVPGFNGYATWPKGRLVALESPGDGEFSTVAVIPPGSRIRLNAQVKPSGYLRVAVRNFDGGVLDGRGLTDCDRLIGDDAAMPVTWKGDGDLKSGGRPIILSFQMRQAKLFGIEFVRD